MTLLENHLEQISLSSAAITELPFTPPKIFTNAILHSHDITALIRDTEAHERALFSLATPDQLPGVPDADLPRRSTIHNTTGGGPRKPQKHSSAVPTLLGGELGEQISVENAKEGKDRSDVDVNLLLKGAEKLCSVYPIEGAAERIALLRSRYEQLNASITRYEGCVAKQSAQLSNMNKQKGGDEDEEDEKLRNDDGGEEFQVTQEDIQKEHEEIEELEKKKRLLEDRVSGMERDLGGLLR